MDAALAGRQVLVAIHDCGEEIVWIMRADGTWHPPLEPDASGVSLEGVVVVMEDPNRPRLINTNQLAIYRPHVCARRPAVRPYSPPKRTATFDELAIEKERQERAESVRLLGEEETRKREQNARYRDRDSYTRTGTLRADPRDRVIDVSCPECGSPPGMICFSPKLKVPRSSPHNERKWLVVEKGLSGNARREIALRNGYGIRPWLEDADRPDPVCIDDERGNVNVTMCEWLRDNAHLFTDLA